MTRKKEQEKPRYQLRQAAGSFWILDMWQEGVPYQKPLSVNQVGADIWKLMEQQKSDEEIVELLGRKYSVSGAELQRDFTQFREELQKYGISI